MIRKILLLTLGLAAPLTMHAAPSLGLQTTSYTLNPGESFTIALVLSNPEALRIAGFNLSVSSDTNGIFALDSRSYPTVINDPNSSLVLPNHAITTGSSADLGATSDFVYGVTGSNVTISTYTFHVLASVTAGNHLLRWTGPGAGGVPTLSDTSFTDFENPAPLAASITVVPEPATFTSVLAGAILLIRRRRT